MGEEAESEEVWWGQTHPRRGQRGGRAWAMSGQAAGLQLVSFWLRLRDGEI